MNFKIIKKTIKIGQGLLLTGLIDASVKISIFNPKKSVIKRFTKYACKGLGPVEFKNLQDYKAPKSQRVGMATDVARYHTRAN